jgi:Polysaccharide deacetylase
MKREQGARGNLSKTMAHGLVSWGILLCLAGVILVTRLHAAQATRAPLPPLPGKLSAVQERAWKSFPMYRNVVPVLNYHSVGGRSSYITVSRHLFADQMRALKVSGFHTLTIKQYAAYVRGDTSHLPTRPILITFDDGRLDASRAANSILRFYGFHATELVVPAWVNAHPHFSLSWSEIQQMTQSGTWDVQPHFGYGQEEVPIDKRGDHGATFAFLEYLRGTGGHPGHLESFPHFQRRLTGNMFWGVRRLRQVLPGFHSYAMAIPESDYGQGGTNDLLIPPYVLSWLDHNFPVVFGGDYLNGGKEHTYVVPGRFSPRLSYRMSMGPLETLPALHCRLLDWVRHAPIWVEYHCLKLTGPASVPQD